MNTAISNFAWENNQHASVFNELKKYNINKIESVLTKINSWENLNVDIIKNYKNELLSYNIEPYSIQSLLYNVPCKSLCEEKTLIKHFIKLIKFSEILGVKILVLGSPSLRILEDKWNEKLVHTLNIIDEMLGVNDIKLVIEPNCSLYGGQYFKTLGEIVLFLDINKFDNIKTMIDTHNSLYENSDPNIELEHFFDYIEHIHISELKLEPLKDLSFHKKFSETIKKKNYDKVITFELGKCENFSDAIEKFAKIYNL